MPLKIIAQGHARDLADDAADELIRRLRLGGLTQRDPDSGEVVERSPMAQLAENLTAAREASSPYRPAEDEQGILYVLADGWLRDVSEPGFPKQAMTLRYALFCDLDDRRRHDTASRTS